MLLVCDALDVDTSDMDEFLDILSGMSLPLIMYCIVLIMACPGSRAERPRTRGEQV